jgi:hypothetical protein
MIMCKFHLHGGTPTLPFECDALYRSYIWQMEEAKQALSLVMIRPAHSASSQNTSPLLCASLWVRSLTVNRVAFHELLAHKSIGVFIIMLAVFCYIVIYNT